MTRIVAFLGILLLFGGARLAGEKDQAEEQVADEDDEIRSDNENIRLNPSAAAYCIRGIHWRRRGQYDKAIADFDETLRLNPLDADAYYVRGKAWLAKGDLQRANADFDEAIRVVDDAVKRNPQSADAYYRRGRVWWLTNKYELALADYNEALRLDPKHVRAAEARKTLQTVKETLEADAAVSQLVETLRWFLELSETIVGTFVAETGRLK